MPAKRSMDRDAESELRALNAYLDAIVENIPDMIFVKDAQSLAFQRFNRAGEDLLGWSRAELLGKTDHDFYPKEQADFFHQMDREALRAGKLVDIPEECIQTKHAGLRWLHTRKVPIYDETGKPLYLLGMSEDITARKLAEERARELERELASVVLHTREAILSWNLDGKIASWNQAAESLYGVPTAEAIGMPVERLLPDEELPAFRTAQKQLLAGKTPDIADVCRLHGSSVIEVEESLFLIRDAAGNPARIGSVARPIGELRRLRRATEILSGTEPHRMTQADAVSQSARMLDVLSAAEIAAQQGQATILLLGDTGVGKGWLARRIHAQSPRVSKPFFEVNCACLAPHLVESELFGHERGAFTGADSQKRGLVEVAEGGTLFLDEIGELPPAVQARLLTFLDSRSFRRVGGVRNLVSDVRVLAATNLDLKSAVERGTFRKDLYYRLNLLPILVPSLCERPEDIPLLAQNLLRELVGDVVARRAPLSPDVLEALSRYSWPGNVRELRNALERALILGRGGPIQCVHLPAELFDKGGKREGSASRLDAVERQQIRTVLEREGGNRTRAAEVLGISRATLKRRLREIRESSPRDGSESGKGIV